MTRDSPLPPRYEHARLVARGGMGDIYIADDRELSRQVAVKLLIERFATDLNLRQRFEREALAAARLSGHPHIVTIYDVGEWRDRPLIVMEYLPGGTIADRVKGGPVPVSRALHWLGQAAAALDAAHFEGILHRDVKPANLLFDRREQLRVADFGIARILDESAGLTLTGTILGTAGYLSPEQAQGRPATEASDVYSLAVVAYELLTGSRPFERGSATAEAAAHVNDPVPPASERNDALGAAIDDVLARALAKNPDERHETPGAFVADLADAATPREEPTRVLAAPPPPPPHTGARTRTRLVAGAVAILLLGAGGAAAALTMSDDDGTQVRTLVRRQTVTTAGAPEERKVTVTETVEAEPPPSPPPVAEPPPPPPPTAEPPPPTPSSRSGAQLNLDGFQLMQSGRYSEALPVLRQAVAKLQGTYRSDFPDEAYANYNLGYTLLQLGSCAKALPYLDRSEQLQGHRDEIKEAQKEARKCLKG